jgi:hypothetical protein
MTCFQAKDCDVPNTLNLYLRAIKDGPLLSAMEERELAVAIARGDRDARARMIQSNPQPSVIFFLPAENSRKGLENPRRSWNNG